MEEKNNENEVEVIEESEVVSNKKFDAKAIASNIKTNIKPILKRVGLGAILLICGGFVGYGIARKNSSEDLEVTPESDALSTDDDIMNITDTKNE